MIIQSKNSELTESSAMEINIFRSMYKTTRNLQLEDKDLISCGSRYKCGSELYPWVQSVREKTYHLYQG